MRIRKKSVLAFGVGFLLVGMGFAAVPIGGCGGGEPPAVLPPTVTKTVSPTDIYFGTGDKETTVTITVTGDGGTSSTITPMDVVFAIDSSGSMDWNDPDDLRLDAANYFVDQMDDSRDTGGVVSWDYYIDFTFGLSNDFDGTDGLEYWINQVDHVGGTSLNVGLNAAIDMLDANTRTGDSVEVIIFLTDGQGTYTYAADGGPASEAASKGYIIYSIGLSESAWEDPLEDMAGATGGSYYDSPDAENLQDIYDAIFEEIITSNVPHYVDVIEVTKPYIIGHHNFNIAPDSITTAADGTTTIIWYNIGQYVGDYGAGMDADETVTLTFDVRSAIYGMNLDVQVYGIARVTYDDKDGNYFGYVKIPQAKINVHPYITDLIAGGGNEKSQIDVGYVLVYNDEDWLYIKYVTEDGWYMTETHLHVATDPDDIPQKNGNPTPGKFDYSNDHSPAVQEYMYKIPWTWDAGTTLYIAAHAVVEKVVGYQECEPIIQEETAWADGTDFPGKNWATYFEYEDP